METTVQSRFSFLYPLLRADFITQWRNRKSMVLLLIVPVIILISWKNLVSRFGGNFVLSNCITIGLTAVGLMGYSNAIARDRDKGVFQRLRVAPVPGWSIMASRLIVQLAMIVLITTAVFGVGYYVDKISISPVGYCLGYLAALLSGAVYLGAGQAIVGLVRQAETVNAVTRLVYFIFIMVGMLGELGVLGKVIARIVKWSPYGVVKHLLSDSMEPALWNYDTSLALLATLGYALVFCTMGIKWFKWTSN